MRPKSALLVGVGAVGNVVSTLRAILWPHFVAKLHLSSTDSHCNAAGNTNNELATAVRSCEPVLIYLILACPEYSATKDTFTELKRLLPEVAVTVVLEDGDPDQILQWLKLGAADYLVSPLRPCEVLPRAWRSLRSATPSSELIKTVKNEMALTELVGQSAVFRQQAEKLPLIANCDANVLIGGETGTGKELYARAVHYCSPRAAAPFVPVNCGAIPVELVENELFGHHRGAFTGAFTPQTGLIEEANCGTLFLDEIDCLSQMAQVKLLRFLQEKEYRPLGSPHMRRANVRIIAASNVSLDDAVIRGKLRQDLFYRLNVVSLLLPPLRERREDVPLLAEHFAAKYSAQLKKRRRVFSAEALQALMAHDWPGNVRELEHVVERAIVMSDGHVLSSSDLEIAGRKPDAHPESLKQAKTREIARFEKSYLRALLSACDGNITRAAQIAQKNRRAFWQLIQKYKIEAASFKSHP